MNLADVPIARDADAEVSLLACIFRDPTRLHHARSLVTETDFTVIEIRNAWGAACALQDLGEPVDIETVVHRMRMEKSPNYWEALRAIEGNVQPETIDHWIDLVIRATRQRRLRHLGLEIISKCNTVEPGEMLTAIASELRSFDDRTRGLVVTAREAADHLIRTIREMNETKVVNAFVSGVDVLDKLFYLKRTDFIVFAGRPGAGKSFLAAQIARTIAERGGFPFYVSAEMPAEDQVVRASSAYDQIDGDVFRLPSDQKSVDRACEAVNKVGALRWAFTQRVEFETVMRIARDLRQRGELDIMIVDYIQRMKSQRDYGVSRDEQIGQITSALKQFALDERVPVIAISSMSRPQKGKETKRPTMSDLRESGNLESDADNILLIHRTGKDTAEWIIEKGRAKEDRLVIKMRRAFHKGGWEEAPPDPPKRDGKADAGAQSGEPDPFSPGEKQDDLYTARPAGR